MKTKIALFLSAILTAFVVAVLSGVVNKVTSASPANSSAPVQAAAQQDATTTLDQPTPTDLPTAILQTSIDPIKAATLAAQAINRQDVYSVETSTYNGVNAYKVVFSSGDVVYVGFDAQVLALTKSQPAVVANAPATNPPARSSSHFSEGRDHEGGD